MESTILEKVKEAMDITGNASDENIRMKILAVESYMSGAGVSLELIADPLGEAVIVIGVNDIWDLRPGELKFSGAFHLLMEQLKVRSLGVGYAAR